MDNLLSSFDLDVVELLEDLQIHWRQRKELFQHNANALTRLKVTGSNVMFCCPQHAETKPSCGMKKEFPYSWHCFGCGASGSLGSFVAHVLGLRSELLGEQFILKNYLVVSSNGRLPFNIDEILDHNDLDRKRSRFEEEVQHYLLKRHSYITSRGFSDLTLRKYEVGFDEKNSAITFPVRTSKGHIRFIKKRFVNKKGFLNESGIDKKDILYGLYYLLQSPNHITEIDLNESETDTMACYESKRPACAILGRLLFKEQVQELIKSGIKTVNLFFDNDRHGVECTIRSYQLLARLTPIVVNVILYPGGHWGIDGTGEMRYKDSNDLLKAHKMQSIRVVPFDVFFSKLKYKNELGIDVRQSLF